MVCSTFKGMVLKFQKPRNHKLWFNDRLVQKHTSLFALGIACLAMAQLAPSLVADFYADDYHLYWMTHHQIEPYIQKDKPRVLDYFTFLTGDNTRTAAMIEMGMTPWWIDRQSQLHFFRPLSELTHYLDFTLFHDRLPMQLHSLLWYALLLMLAFRMYQRLLVDESLVLLAFSLFAFNAHTSITISWLANRNALIAGCFGLLSIHAYLTFLQSRQLLSLALSLIFLTAALLSAEIAISVLPAFFCLLLVYKATLTKQYGKMSLCPFIVIAGWLVFYQYYGFGAWSSSGYYLNIFTQPAAFLTEALSRLSEAIIIQTTGLPDSLIVNKPFVQKTAILISLAIFAVVYTLYNRAVWLLLLSSLCALIPILSTEVQGRNLLFCSLYTSPLFALIISGAFRIRRKTLVARCFFQGVAITLFIFHLLFALVIKPLNAHALQLESNSQKQLIQSAPTLTMTTFILGNNVFDQVALISGRFYYGLTSDYPLINLITQPDDLKIEYLSDGFRLSNTQGLLTNQDKMFLGIFKANQLYIINKDISILIVDINENYLPKSIQVITKKPYQLFIKHRNTLNKIK